MKFLPRLRAFFFALFHRSRAESDMDEELRSHIASRTEDLINAGLPPEEATRRARLDFGGVQKIREEIHDASGVAFFDSLLQDVHFGFRMLRRSPGFTFVAVLTLALGIGANTAIFSIVDTLLLRPLPVSNPGQLAVLAFRQGSGPLLSEFSIADYEDIRSQTSDAFTDILGFQLGFDGLSRAGKADRTLTAYVTGNFFSMLGLKPYLGRLIVPSEGRTHGADPIVVLSYGYWQTHFGSDTSIVGQRILVNGFPAQVVGVAPRDFFGLYPAPGVDAYLPLAMLDTYEQGWPKDFMVNRILQNLFLLGRLRPGVPLESAGAALNVVARRLSAQYPETDKSMKLSVYSERLARPDPGTGERLIQVAALFLVLVGLVLLLACANIANLLLVRATARHREMAIRAALGAARGRMIRQLLTESILLALVGGAAGLVLGLWAAGAVAAINLHMPINVHLYSGFDWRIFAYSFGAALFTGVLLGLIPAWRASRAELGGALHESSRSIAGGKNRLRTGLVVLQVAGSLMLLVIAGLFTRSLTAVQHADLGFDPHNVVVLTVDPNELGYSQTQGLAFYDSLLQRVRSLPGVESAALTSNPPMSNFGSNDYLKVADYQNPPGQGLPLVYYGVVSSGLFRAMHIPILSGRAFTDGDRQGSPYVAIVNQAFAHRFWPNQNPIGKHFTKVSGATNPTYEVVGVAQDSHFLDLAGPIPAYFFLPLTQNYSLASLQTLEIRSSAPAGTVIREARDTMHSLAPGLPVFDVETMEESLDTLSGFLIFRLGAGLAASLGLLGLVLAVVGVYGVISYSTAQRTHEIGIRMALGAEPSQILAMILRQGIVIVAVGIFLGCLAALATARLITGFLVGVGPGDPLTYLSVTLMLSLVALAACFVPARRAMRIAPVEALRHE